MYNTHQYFEWFYKHFAVDDMFLWNDTDAEPAAKTVEHLALQANIFPSIVQAMLLTGTQITK